MALLDILSLSCTPLNLIADRSECNSQNIYLLKTFISHLSSSLNPLEQAISVPLQNYGGGSCITVAFRTVVYFCQFIKNILILFVSYFLR